MGSFASSTSHTSTAAPVQWPGGAFWSVGATHRHTVRRRAALSRSGNASLAAAHMKS